MQSIRRTIGPPARAVLKWTQAILLSPIILLVAILRPVLLVRFGVVDAERIGHLCNVEGYLCRRDVDRSQKLVLDLIGCSPGVCNEQLLKMFKRELRLWNLPGLIGALEKASLLWMPHGLHRIEFLPHDLSLLESRSSHLRFTEAEQAQGEALLARLGIPSGARWVCIHNRDGSYLDKAKTGTDWSYHRYRDFDIESMKLCAEELAGRGYYVLRMGSTAEQPLESTNPRVIDFANHPEQCEFADIYLLGKCQFYLGSDSGIFAVATIFNRPFAFINFPVPQAIYSFYHWNPTPFLLKRAWHKEWGRMLSLRELFELGLANTYHTQDFEAAGIVLINNTAEEIRAFAIEVDERINGRWNPSAGDEELQLRLWSVFAKFAPPISSPNPRALIGAEFLRNHADLLN